jgi:hypothetical protein
MDLSSLLVDLDLGHPQGRTALPPSATPESASGQTSISSSLPAAPVTPSVTCPWGILWKSVPPVIANLAGGSKTSKLLLRTTSPRDRLRAPQGHCEHR